ncbi:MAG TPA: carbon-nitrogen hydrolase family protein [Bryobacteraceae bacterium]|nr:carbon-nitrogen hydrolase family protein [Bryobacteraceae bacterium]
MRQQENLTDHRRPAAVRIGMGQITVDGGAYQDNLSRAVETIAEAGRRKCTVVVLPECLDAGWTYPGAMELSHPVPGPTTDILARAAREASIHVVAGVTERASNGSVYNTAVLLGPNGDVLSRHRKINELSIAHHLYATGDSLSVVQTPFGRVGLTVCADNYPDSLVFAHSLARMQAQFILSPCAWAVDGDHDNVAAPYGARWHESYSTIARLYDVTVVGVSCVGWLREGPWRGRKCIGNSLAYGPGGECLVEAPYGEDATTFLTAEVNPSGLRVRGTNISEHLKDLTERDERATGLAR